MYTFFKLTSLFPFWHQGCNTESWLLTKKAKSPCCATYGEGHPMRLSTYVGTQNSPSSSLWICADQPPKLHGTERTVTKTNAKVCRKYLFLQLFFFSLSLSLNINPFYSNKLLSCSFSFAMCHATVSLVFFHTLQILILSYSQRLISQQLSWFVTLSEKYAAPCMNQTL